MIVLWLSALEPDPGDAIYLRHWSVLRATHHNRFTVKVSRDCHEVPSASGPRAASVDDCYRRASRLRKQIDRRARGGERDRRIRAPVGRRRRAASTSSPSESRGGPERTRPDRSCPFLIHRLAAVGGIGGNEHGTCAINSSRHPYPQPPATGRNDNNHRIIAFTINDRKYENSRLQWALGVSWLHDTANWCVTVKHTGLKALNINYCTCIKI